MSVTNNMIKWVITNSANYKIVPQKDPNSLYFLQDTGEIYKGDKSFTESVQLVSDFPESGGLGKVYVNETTLEGKVWNGTSWKPIIKPVTNTVEAESTKPVSGQAVQNYVASEFAKQVTGKFFEGVTYNKESKELSYTKGEEQVKVGIEGFITDADFDGASGNLTFTVQGGDQIVVNLPKENFVTGGSYDTDSGEIILTLQEGEVRIPASDLVDVYVGVQTNSVTVSVDDSNNITADVRISSEVNNQIVVRDDGLYVNIPDASDKLDKVLESRANEIIIAKEDGTVEVSGVKVGEGTINQSPNVNTVATEAAVDAIRASLQSKIDGKFDTANILTSASASSEEASDLKVLSEKAVLTAIENLKVTVEDTLTKSDIVSSSVNIEQPSEEKVVSEKALVSAMSWTIV